MGSGGQIKSMNRFVVNHLMIKMYIEKTAIISHALVQLIGSWPFNIHVIYSYFLYNLDATPPHLYFMVVQLMTA